MAGAAERLDDVIVERPMTGKPTLICSYGTAKEYGALVVPTPAGYRGS